MIKAVNRRYVVHSQSQNHPNPGPTNSLWDGSGELSNLVAGAKILNDLMAHYIKNEYPESELTGKIIGAAVEVHKHLAMGFRRL
jgi:hypothetical protein